MNKVTDFQINDHHWETAVKKFNKTVKNLDEDVAVLQEWLKTQPHLPDLLDTNSLRNFLILNKFSIEVAKQKIDNYFTLRVQFHKIYGKTSPKLKFNEKFGKEAYKYLGLSLTLTRNMDRISYIKVKNVSLTDDYEPVWCFKRFLTIQDLRLRKDILVGDIIVVDLKGFPVSVIAKITPLLYRGVIIYEKSFSMRLKGVYIINFPSYANVLLTTVKKFMKPKLFDRIKVFKDCNDLKKYIPVEILPPEFGGEGKSLDYLEENLNKMYREEYELFESLDEMVVDENLRPQKLENDDIMGAFGNFKKLEID